MTRLVEQGDHVVMTEGGWPVPDRTGEVAHQIGDRRLGATRSAVTAARGIHPGPAALGLTGMQIEIKMAEEVAMPFDPEEMRARIPLGRLGRQDIHSVQSLNHAEQAFDHFVLGEVLLDLLIRERIALLAQLFGYIGHIPRLQLG